MTELELAGIDGSTLMGELDELALAARSNPRTFEALYGRHKLSVFRFMRGRTDSNDEAADLTSIVFERALRSIDRYQPSSGRFVAWLFTTIFTSAGTRRSRRSCCAHLLPRFRGRLGRRWTGKC